MGSKGPGRRERRLSAPREDTHAERRGGRRVTRPGGSRSSRNSGSEAGGGGKGGEGPREPPGRRLKWGTSPPPSLPGAPGFCDHRPSAASRRETQWKQGLLPPVLSRPAASRMDRSQGGPSCSHGRAPQDRRPGALQAPLPLPRSAAGNHRPPSPVAHCRSGLRATRPWGQPSRGRGQSRMAGPASPGPPCWPPGPGP